MSIGGNIAKLLEEAETAGVRVRQEDLAQAAGVRQSHISRVIRGTIKSPRIELLRSIAEYFSERLGRQITLDDLVSRSGPREEKPPTTHKPQETVEERKARIRREIDTLTADFARFFHEVERSGIGDQVSEILEEARRDKARLEQLLAALEAAKE